MNNGIVGVSGSSPLFSILEPAHKAGFTVSTTKPPGWTSSTRYAQVRHNRTVIPLLQNYATVASADRI
jgi:hypothetical protein